MKLKLSYKQLILAREGFSVLSRSYVDDIKLQFRVQKNFDECTDKAKRYDVIRDKIIEEFVQRDKDNNKIRDKETGVIKIQVNRLDDYNSAIDTAFNVEGETISARYIFLADLETFHEAEVITPGIMHAIKPFLAKDAIDALEADDEAEEEKPKKKPNK